MRAAPALALAAAALAACGGDFAPGSRVTGRRILATRADPPFAAPGEVVTLTTLAVDAGGGPSPVVTGVCERPPSADALACVGALGPAPLVPVAPAGGAATYALTVPADALAGAAEGARANAYVGAVAIACPGDVDRARGPEGLPFRCADERGAALPLGAYDLAVKRVFVRTRDRNANPAIERVLLDGAPWPEDEVRAFGACAPADADRYDDCEGEEHALAPAVDPASRERGTDEFGAAFEEQLLVSYYATEGVFQYDVRDGREPATAYKARAGARGGAVTIWIVLRDDRGGVAWTARRATVY